MCAALACWPHLHPQTQDEEQGSYSRVLGEWEAVHCIQARWQGEGNRYFTLGRKARPHHQDHFMASPVVLSGEGGTGTRGMLK